MAEDKRIRVTADSSPLQELRQNAQALWNDFNRMESSFKGIAEQTVGVIQKQIDLLRERNSLLGGTRGSSLNYLPTEGRLGLIDPHTGRPLNGAGGVISPGAHGRSLNPQFNERQLTTLEKILATVTQMADTMEKAHRDDTNGVLPSGGGDISQSQVPGTPIVGRGGGGRSGRGLSLPMSMGGLMGLLPFGALAMGIGSMLGQQARYDAAQYGAENEFQRQNNRGNHWLLNMLTFGMSGAETGKKEVGRIAMTQNDRALEGYSALHGFSYRKALGSQFIGSFGDNVDYVTGGNTSFHDYKMATDSSYRQNYLRSKGSGGLDLSAGVFPQTQQETFAWQDWRHGQENQQLIAAGRAGLITDRNEIPAWASRTLGLNMTDYTSQVTALQRAGVYGGNTSLNDMNQLLMAGKIRGLSADQAAAVLAMTRFDNSGRSGANVVQAFDSNLRGLGKGDQYIASTLGEHLQAFNRIGENVLSRTGSLNTAGIVRSMTSIQNATGMEGRQLERVQNSLMGNGMSQDDVTQAFLLRAAREIAGPDAQLSDLQAMIETMPNNPELQERVFKNIQKATGGGEMGRQVLSKMFGMKMSDVIALEKATGNDYKKIFQGGRSIGDEYSEEDSRSRVGDISSSTAATQNRKIKEGYETIGGKSFIADTIKAIADEGPIPVTIVAAAPGSAGSGVGQIGGFSDEQFKKIKENVFLGVKEGVSTALNGTIIQSE